MKPKIMYIERKAGNLTGEARIGRVTFSNSGKTIHYKDKRFQSLDGQGFQSNYYDLDTGEDYWISGCKKNGKDRVYGKKRPVEIDTDVRKEYWIEIRQKLENKNRKYA